MEIAPTLTLLVVCFPYLTGCTGCDVGFCGRDCKKQCTGHCLDACDKHTCLCNLCADGHYKENCSIPCSETCYSVKGKKSCDMENGACKDGCIAGYCSRDTGCEKKCGKNCKNESCDMDCFCDIGCKDGYYGQKCEQGCQRGKCLETCLKCEQYGGKCTLCVHGERQNETDLNLNCDQCCNLSCNCNQTTEGSPQSMDSTVRVPPLLAFFLGSFLTAVLIIGGIQVRQWVKSDGPLLGCRDISSARCTFLLLLYIIAVMGYFGILISLVVFIINHMTKSLAS